MSERRNPEGQGLEPASCAFPGCPKSTEAALGDRHLCLEHFTVTCFEQLDDCERRLGSSLKLDQDPDSLQQLLTEFAEQAAKLAQRRTDLENLERARLCYIQIVAGEIGRRLRRSPRTATVIPIQIRGEENGRAWEEEAKTLTISRQGALIECRRPVRDGDRFLISRQDTGQQAGARVVWQRNMPEGKQEVGVELMDCENFWGVDWSTANSSNGTRPRADRSTAREGCCAKPPES
jgi:hypothetical protein